jgi:hypothetical protein
MRSKEEVVRDLLSKVKDRDQDRHVADRLILETLLEVRDLLDKMSSPHEE